MNPIHSRHVKKLRECVLNCEFHSLEVTIRRGWEMVRTKLGDPQPDERE